MMLEQGLMLTRFKILCGNAQYFYFTKKTRPTKVICDLTTVLTNGPT